MAKLLYSAIAKDFSQRKVFWFVFLCIVFSETEKYFTEKNRFLQKSLFLQQIALYVVVVELAFLIILARVPYVTEKERPSTLGVTEASGAITGISLLSRSALAVKDLTTTIPLQ